MLPKSIKTPFSSYSMPSPASSFMPFAPLLVPAYLLIAFEIGCELALLKKPASLKSSSFKLVALTLKEPFVSVPVLSKATIFAPLMSSIMAGFFMRIPDFEPLLRAQTMAIGVASPKAQGQEITSTQIAQIAALLTSKKLQIISVSSEIAITLGTKIFEILSARRAMFSFLLALCCKLEIMPSSRLSFGFLAIFASMVPFMFVLPPKIFSPTLLYRGRLSPFIALSSNSAPP